jgi:hypothetical protein
MEALYPQRSNADLIRWLAIGLRWGRFDLFALVGGALGLLIFGGLFFLGANEPGGHYGLVQRLALAAGGFWILTLTAGLLVVHDSSGRLSALVSATRRARRRGT